MASTTEEKLTIALDDDLSADERREVGLRIIENILDRTEDGVRPDTGEAYPSYSDSYKNSSAYKAFKSSDTPNLRLFGNMMANLQVLSVGPSSVTIGFTGEQAQKSVWNSANNKRVHIAVSEADLAAFQSEVRSERQQEEDAEAASIFNTLIANQIIDLFGGNDAS